MSLLILDGKMFINKCECGTDAWGFIHRKWRKMNLYKIVICDHFCVTKTRWSGASAVVAVNFVVTGTLFRWQSKNVFIFCMYSNYFIRARVRFCCWASDLFLFTVCFFYTSTTYGKSNVVFFVVCFLCALFLFLSAVDDLYIERSLLWSNGTERGVSRNALLASVTSILKTIENLTIKKWTFYRWDRLSQLNIAFNKRNRICSLFINSQAINIYSFTQRHLHHMLQ